VLNHILGTSFSSRAYSELRSRRGLVYQVFGLVASQWDHRGLFFLSTSTRVATTGAAIEALLELTRELAEKPPSSEEVEHAKSATLNSFLFETAVPAGVLKRRVSYELYGYPLDWMEQYRDGIVGVTADEVGAVAARYLKPETILVVGPTAGLDRPLESFGEVHSIDLRASAPTPETIADAPEIREQGAAAIAAAVAGIGGRERLSALSGFEIRVKAVLTTPRGEMELAGHSVVQFPDRMRREMVFPNGSMTEVLAGDSAFAQTAQGVVPLAEARRLDLVRSMLRDPVALLKLSLERDLLAVAAGTIDDDGQRLVLVRVELDGEAMTLGIDPPTGRVMRLAYQGQNVAGVQGETVQRYSDFREVDGLLLPFASVSTSNGEPMVEISVESLELDPEIAADTFALP
jgi:hypothetical protein